MKIYKNIQPNNKFKIFTILLFFGLFFIANEVLALAYPYTPYTDDKASQNIWRENPYDCPIDIDGEAPNDGRVLCGFTGTAEWYFPFNLTTSSVSSTVSNYADTRSIPYNKLKKGGFVINCAAYDSSEPYCNNSGSYWCNADSSCQETLRVQTICNENKWASDDPSSAFTCVTPGAAPSTTGCISGYANCSSTAPGCETRIGVTSCTGAGGLQGTLNASCDCIVPASNFRTGIQAEFLTSSPLLWGKQYGDGDLIRFTNNAVATSSFVVFNSGQVAIGHNINVSTTSVAFEVSSTQRGILIPRLGGTNPITNGVDGELYYNTTSKKFMYYNGLAWGELGGGLPSGSIGQILVNNGEENWVTSSVIRVNTSTGRVGIGTIGVSNPIAALEIGSGGSVSMSFGNASDSIVVQGDGGGNFFEGYNTDGASGLILRNTMYSAVGDIAGVINEEDNFSGWDSGLHIFSQSSDPIIFKTGSTTERMRIISNGNIGIGATSPQGKLSVVSNYGYDIYDDNSFNSLPTLLITDVSSTVQNGQALLRLNSSNGNLASDFNLDIFLRTADDGSPRVGILTNGPLDNPGGNFEIGSLTNGIDLNFITSNTTRMSIRDGGNVGIGTSAPQEKLSVVGNISNLITKQSGVKIIATESVESSPRSIDIFGNYAYIANHNSNTISIVDISNPYLPVQISTTSVGTWPSSIRVSGKYVYVINRSSNNLYVVDVSNPSSPTTVSVTNVSSSPLSIYISGKYAYIAHSTSNKISVIDISNPYYPTVVSSIATGHLSNNPQSIYVSGNYAYVSGGTNNTFLVFDISNPYSPIQISSISMFGLPGSIYVSGKYAYVARLNGTSIGIIDISNPYSPNIISDVTVGTNPNSIYVSGRYAYVANRYTNNISVVDVSNPYSPIQISTTSVSSSPEAIHVSGRYAYVANSDSNKISVIDITGTEVSSLVAHSSEIGNLQVRNDIITQGVGQFGSLNVGAGGLLVNGSLSVSATNSPSYFGGSVGVGITNPLAKLHLAGDGAILATGTMYDVSGWDGGTLGAGSRLMWIPSKGAFRAGYVYGSQWNNTNIGNGSVAFGESNTASGYLSTVLGGSDNTISNGFGVIIGGSNNQIAGISSLIFGGSYNSVTGTNSMAFGRYMNITGNYSFGVNVSASTNKVYLSEDNVIAFVGGKVGIGTTSPQTILDVTGDAPEVRIYDTNSSNRNPRLSFIRGTISSTFGADIYRDWRFGAESPGGSNFVLQSAASGVVTTSVLFLAGGGVEINGSLQANKVGTGDGYYVCINNTTGLLYKRGTACTGSSDSLLKNDIVSISAEKNVLELLDQIRGVYYYWNSSSPFTGDPSRKIGVIAQEIESVLPELVETDINTTYKSVDYPKLTAFLVEVAKAQQAEIEALREAVSTTLSVQQSGSQIIYPSGDLDLQNYALLNVKNIIGTDNKWAIDESGQFITRIQTSGGNTKEMFAMQSPYSEFVFSSSSELINGEAIINFDPDTCELIDETQPLKVNITLTGECGGIFVKEKSATGFVVKELNGGTSTSTFDWMVIAKRKFATTSPQSSSSQGEEGVPSPLEGEGEDEVEIPSTLEGEGEGEVVTTTPEIPPEPPVTEPTTTPEIPPEPPAEAESLTEQSSGDGEPTPPAEETP